MKHLVSVRAARYLRKGGYSASVEIAAEARDRVAVDYLEKTLIPAAMAGASDSLVVASTAEARELSKYLLADSVIGKIMSKALPVPFNSGIGSVWGAGADWVKEGHPVRVQKGQSAAGFLEPYKVMAMVVVDGELDRLATPGTDVAISGMLSSAAVKKMDETFLSDAAGVEELYPAGAMNGAATAHGYSDLFKTHADNGNNLNTSFLIVSVDELLIMPGDFLKVIEKTGVTLISSQHAPGVSLVDASKMMIQMSGTALDSSDRSDIEMSDAPTQEAETPAGSEMMSLFQSGGVAYRAITYCSWAPLAGAKPVTVLGEPQSS